MGYYGRRNRRNRNATYIDSKASQNNDALLTQATDTITAYTQSLLELFTRSNSILVGQSVKCILSDETPVACTDGQNVYFNSKMIVGALTGADKGKLNVSKALSSLAHIRGVNLHELAHIKYSPRKGQLPWNEVEKLQQEINSDPDLFSRFHSLPVFRLWNLLEDLRIESLFSTQYRNAIPYFNQTVTKILLGDKDARPEMFHLWLYGRRYVPANIRNDARELFVTQNKVTASDLELWESIIDDYRSFIFPKDGRRIAPLLLQFMELWVKYFPSDQLPESGTGPDGQGGHGERRHGAPPTAGEQRDAQQRREETEEGWEDAEDAEDDSDSVDSDGEEEDSDDDRPEDSSDGANGSGNGEESDSESEDEDESGQGLSGDGDASDAPEQQGDDSSSDSTGSGTAKGDETNSAQSSLAQSLIESLEDSLSETSSQLLEETTDTLKQVLHRAERLKVDRLFAETEKPVAVVPATPKFKAVSNALNNALRQLRSDNDSMWDRGVPTGRLNIGLAINAEAQDSDSDVFERWNDSGDDAPRVELVILLDQSASMSSDIPTSQSSGYHNTMAEASAAMWAIKHACQQNDIPCTVIGYSNASLTSILYRADDKVNRNVGVFAYKNMTDPSVALKIAHSLFAQSDATNKILVSISDGAWSCSQQEVETVRGLHALDVESIFVALPCHYRMSAEGTIVPDYAHALDSGVHMGWNHDNKPIYSAPFYEHRVGIKVANPTELAKKIGRAIISASR